MTNEEMFENVKLGNVTFDEFIKWLDEKCEDRYHDGYDVGYESGLISYERE